MPISSTQPATVTVRARAVSLVHRLETVLRRIANHKYAVLATPQDAALTPTPPPLAGGQGVAPLPPIESSLENAHDLLTSVEDHLSTLEDDV
jgi:hypothetical protein